MHCLSPSPSADAPSGRFLRFLGTISLLSATSVASGQTPLTTERVANGLSRPVFATAPVGDLDRLFICEHQSGLVRILRDGSLLPVPFLDVSGNLLTSGDHGLMSIAFHPDYRENGYVYAYYSVPGASTIVERYTVSANPDVVDPSTATLIISIPQPGGNHNGGSIAFNPSNGFMYLGLGDGGGQNDPNCFGQNPQTFLGKMLRIDVDGGSPYVVPPSNPFVGDPNVLDEIWALGMRNPWRWSFDRANGDLYVSDNGQSSWEEIDYEPAGFPGGRNYGWSVMEGSSCFTNTSCSALPPCFDAAYTDPIYEYDHSMGCSVQGGFVYRGCAIPDLQGTYFFGDLCTNGSTQGLWSFRVVGGAVTDFQNRTAELAPSGGLSIQDIAGFGQDGLGELYVIDWGDGEVFKIVPASGIGTNYCSPAVPNSTGLPGVMSAAGVPIPGGPLSLVASDLPANQFGFFLASMTTGTIMPPGSQGILCLAGNIGRFNAQAASSGTSGSFCVSIDTLNMPMNPPVSVMSGETWHFQGWYRDVGGNNNFTDGLSILFL